MYNFLLSEKKPWRLKVFKKFKNNFKKNKKFLRKVSQMSMIILNEKNIVGRECGKHKEQRVERPVVIKDK